MVHLILPKGYLRLTGTLGELPLFCLLGPGPGGGNWQKTVIEMLVEGLRGKSDFIVVNPNPYSEQRPKYPHRIEQNDPENYFLDETLWKQYYLHRAAIDQVHGCIICYLPCESGVEPRIDGYPYAMDARRVIGEWGTHLYYNRGARLVMGAERNFPGLKNIERSLGYTLSGFQVHTTLEEVVGKAIQEASPR